MYIVAIRISSVTLISVEMQRTPAWHAARKGKLTASNIGAAMGLCEWTSRQQAFNRATGREKFLGESFNQAIGHVPMSKLSPLPLLYVGNEATRWGVSNESNGILAYIAHTGNVVDATGLHIHPSNTWLAGSPDGLVGTEGMIEVKCPYWRFGRGGERRGVHKEIPAYYYLQMQLCLECTDRKWCDYICWLPDEYCVYRVTRDESLHDMLLPHYLKFFGAMQREASCPPVQSSDEKLFIKSVVASSMLEHCDYKYWSNADPSAVCPSPSLSDDSDDEPLAKRVKI